MFDKFHSLDNYRYLIIIDTHEIDQRPKNDMVDGLLVLFSLSFLISLCIFDFFFQLQQNKQKQTARRNVEIQVLGRTK